MPRRIELVIVPFNLFFTGHGDLLRASRDPPEPQSIRRGERWTGKSVGGWCALRM